MDEAASTTPVTTCAEESGWTTYLEGFSGDNEGSFSSSLDGSSMISDAASGSAWKFLQNNRLPKETKIPRKVNVKKPRDTEISQDDSLEDTASSPVNRSKVGVLHPTDTVYRKTCEHSTNHTQREYLHHRCRFKTRVNILMKGISAAKASRKEVSAWFLSPC